MANKYFEAGEGRAARVNDLFAAIAPRYDLINDLQSFGLHRWWKRRLVKLADPRPGERALDLCCGTGDIALALARRGVEVVGLDFSEPMLAVARERSKAIRQRRAIQPETRNPKPETRNPEPMFLQGDAQHTDLPGDRFDIVTIGYGLRNLANWEAGLEEMHRVARPGGRLLVLDFGKPDWAVWRGLYFAYLRWGVPAFGKIFCGNSPAYAYIFESLQRYPAQRGVAAKLQSLRCAGVRTVNLLGGIMSISYARKAG